MKKTLLALLLVLLAINASAAFIQTSSQQAKKGDLIEIHGILEEANNGTISAVLNEKTIFEKSFQTDQNNEFYLNYQTSFLDPTGNWTIKIADFNAQTGIEVLPTIESSVFVVRFLSPSQASFKRNDTIQIAVQALRDENPVPGLQVYTWGVHGEKKRLTEKSPGIYVLDYKIPFDAKTGEWRITTVMSQTENAKEVFGGEKDRYVSIEKATIVFDILKPDTPKINLGQTIEIKVKPKYAVNGEPPKNVLVTGLIATQPIGFSAQPDGTFFAQYTPTQNQAGEIQLEIKATDSAGNSGETKGSIIVGGQAEYAIRQNLGPIAIGAILALLIVYFLAAKTMRFEKSKKLQDKKKALEEKLKSLQKEYFEFQSLDRATFEQRSAKLESELAQTEKELQSSNKKNKNNKNA